MRLLKYVCLYGDNYATQEGTTGRRKALFGRILLVGIE